MTTVQELTALDATVERAVDRLFSLQHPDGWWKGELESNATMIAEHLFLLHFLGLRDPETDRLLANELLARRREDGTWSIWFDGPADLSVAVAAARPRSRGTDPASRRRSALRLRLLLLGPADDGPALGRGGAAARASEPDRPERDRRS